MIKGINRQVIEVKDTGSIYYEQAWFMVKPEYTRIEHTLLENEAKSLLKKADAPSGSKVKRNLLFWVLRLSLAALFGAFCTIVILWRLI